MQSITREQVERRLARNDEIVLVEVLPEANFRKFHLPGDSGLPGAAEGS